jgi:hypothetical protein
MLCKESEGRPACVLPLAVLIQCVETYSFERSRIPTAFSIVLAQVMFSHSEPVRHMEAFVLVSSRRNL